MTALVKPSVATVAAVAVGAVGLLVLWVRTLPKPDNSRVSSLRVQLHQRLRGAKDKEALEDEEFDVVMIGSGMGGLTCAAILARLGKRVLVCEQHPDVLGGGTHMFTLGPKGEYEFDSGLHYTVPWSVPLLALSTGKTLEACTPFDPMGEEDGTVDRLHLFDTSTGRPLEGMGPFKMKRGEGHLATLRKLFPTEQGAISTYLQRSYCSMLFVQVFLFARLLPRKWQKRYWALCRWLKLESRCCVDVTAKECLPSITRNPLLSSLLSSMWIDTGARPDRASFMMTAAVFRGIAMEGGCYPRGGSTALAAELASTIEAHGGRLLVRCPVTEVLIDQNSVIGVKLGADVTVKSRTVVSSAGYINTYKIVSESVRSKLGIPATVSAVPQSAGFVMANIGLDAPPDDLGVTNANTWNIPCDSSGDHFPCLEKYFADPDKCSAIETPAFITFPSVKAGAKGSKVTSCQILFMAEYSWFARFRGSGESKGRAEGAEYERVKGVWADKAQSLLLKYFPRCEGHIALCNISTPLSIEQYLGAHQGGAVGIDVTPARFCDEKVREQLDVVTPIEGLYLTGQDVGFLGVTLCQLTGVLSAFRIAGLSSSLKIVLHSTFRGWGWV